MSSRASRDDEYRQMSDEEVFALVSKRDLKAFDELYRRYERRLMAYCLAIMGERELALDAFQTSMMKVFDARERFLGGNLEAWIFTITRRTCIRIKQDRQRMVSTDDFDERPAESGAGSSLDMTEHQAIHKAVRMLSADYRQIIELRYFGELSYEELAEHLEISIDVVKVRLFRARKKLAELLRPYFT